MGLPGKILDVSRSGLDLQRERRRDLTLQVAIDYDAADILISEAQRLFVPTASAQVVIQVVEPGQLPVLHSQADALVAIVGSGSEEMQSLLGAAQSRGIPHVRLSDSATCLVTTKDVQGIDSDILVLGDDPAALFDQELAGWLSDALPAKRLVLAHNLPFARRAVATEYIRSTAVQNAIVGGVVIIPGADMPVMTANQAKMVLQIAATYGEDIGLARVREILGVLGGAVVMRAAARQVVGLIPALGWAMKSGVAYAGTLAIGYAAIRYFEGTSDNPSVSRRVDEILTRTAGPAKGPNSGE